VRRAAAAITLAPVFLAAMCIALPFPVNAASRTIVVPDDYSTIALAIQNAAEGDTIFIKKGKMLLQYGLHQ